MDLFAFYMAFPIDDHTGDELSEEAVSRAQYEKVQQLQLLFFKHQPKLEELALANCGTVEKRDVLSSHLQNLDPAELKTLVCNQLRCHSRPLEASDCGTAHVSRDYWDCSVASALLTFATCAIPHPLHPSKIHRMHTPHDPPF